VREDKAQAAALPRSEGPSGQTLDNAHVEEAYARWAPIYDLVFAAVMRPGRKAVAAAANRLGGLVLDVGVGTGLELPMFDPKLRLIGVDLSAPMLQRARARIRAQSLHHVAGLVVMDAMHLGFADESFDTVVVPYVLTVVPKPDACLNEWLRVVKKGGEIILVNHIGAESGPMALLEAWLAKHSASLGWRPEFPWSVVGDWIAANPHVKLVERRALAPFGTFTLARILKL
jgi:phosphatidylethanolamine/phosphatidyl-N-methylethanolamine N-methyltransferase